MSGQEIAEINRKRLNKKFFCSRCDLLLVEPMQTPCGHLICEGCVQIIFSTASPVCPKDGISLNEKEIFPDAFTKRELGALELHCLNTECHWTGLVKDLQAHINTCEHTMVVCVHTQCKAKVKRLLLAEHLKDECPYRSVRCENCNESLPFASVKDHCSTCEHALIRCVHAQCQMKFQRSQLSAHLKSDCEYRNVKCDYCQKDVAFASMEEHVKSICEGAPVTCKYCKENVLRKDLKRHAKDDCNEAPATCDFCAIGCNHDKTLKRKKLRQHFKDGLVNHVHLLLQYIVSISRLSNYIPRPEFSVVMQKIRDDFTGVRSALTEKFVMIAGKVAGLERRVDSLESRATAAVIHSYNGTLLWRIDSYERKRQDVINGGNTALNSPPFYSAQGGYKMCAKIYLNGDGDQAGSHLSLFFVVMKGDYDALQTWPFQKKITMMLLNQGDGEHEIKTFHSDPRSPPFQRPTSDTNIPSGFSLSIPLDNLNNHSFIKDDVMFIKIIVE